MINIHHMTRASLAELLHKGELFRGKNGTVKINNHEALHAQVLRESVWVNEDALKPKGNK